MTNTHASFVTAMSVVLGVGACAPRVVPPSPPPARVLGPIAGEMPPPEPGLTPVAIDTVDTPSKVYEFGRDICLTPCVVNLPRGVHDLEFVPVDTFSDRRGAPSISVGSTPMAFRYDLGHKTRHHGLRTGGIVLASLGFSFAVAALPFAFIDDTRSFGVPATVLSGTAMLAGFALLATSRSEVQDGTGTAWPLMGAAPP